jgi:hypothetical protein
MKYEENMRLLPQRVLLLTAGAVGVSTAFLPSVTGYGTILFQAVVLGAWGIVASLTSGKCADLHHGSVWSVAFILNLILFLIPALIVWLVLRKSSPKTCSIVMLVWFVFYMASLFFLFPATDGP